MEKCHVCSTNNAKASIVIRATDDTQELKYYLCPSCESKYIFGLIDAMEDKKHYEN